MNIFVLNSGSSTLKFQLVRLESETETNLCSGVVEHIGGEAVVSYTIKGQRDKLTAPLKDTTQALDFVLKRLLQAKSLEGFQGLGDIQGVGHRVVHGGERFKASALIDENVLRGIEDCIDLAPLHNPANLKGIRAMREILGPAVPQVAVFDTSFHAQMPAHAWLYALPYSAYRRHKIRRYGFHGTSYRFICGRYQAITGQTPAKTNIIVFHLGNGCSAAAIREGISIDTSMGMTPNEGLVMGTRSGDVDPSILEILAAKEGMNEAELQSLLNRSSGLLGISGLTSDMRDLMEELSESQDRRAQLALDIFAYRARKYLGAYLAAIGPIEAVVFCGGIGENAPRIREQITKDLDHLGIQFDKGANESLKGEGVFSKEGSRIALHVIPTNEEIMIARDTAGLIQQK